MPIDSKCTGCGKTLRVGDEFAGRQARCPSCGAVYVVSSSSNVPYDLGRNNQAPSHETPSTLPTLTPLADSWSNMPTSEPLPTSSLGNPLPTSLPQTQSPRSEAQIQSNSERYFVRTPNGSVYGPCDTNTVGEWIQQGRLDDTCHIRPENSEQWIGIPAWQFQMKRKANPVVGLGAVGSSSANPFGEAPISSNQSAGYAKSGNGVLVLILGIVSWILCITILGAPICAIVAIIVGLNELNNIKLGKSPESDRTFALIGLWLGILNLVCSVGMILFVIIVSILNP